MVKNREMNRMKTTVIETTNHNLRNPVKKIDFDNYEDALDYVRKHPNFEHDYEIANEYGGIFEIIERVSE